MAKNYIQPADLKRMVTESQQQAQLTDELVKAVYRIADGYLSRWPYAAAGVDVDDSIQQVLINLMVSLNRIDPERSVFCYITCCLANQFRQDNHARVRRRDGIQRHGQLMARKLGRHVLEA